MYIQLHSRKMIYGNLHIKSFHEYKSTVTTKLEDDIGTIIYMVYVKNGYIIRLIYEGHSSDDNKNLEINVVGRSVD